VFELPPILLALAFIAVGVAAWFLGRRVGAARTVRLPRDYYVGLDHLINDRFDHAAEIFARMAEADDDAAEIQFALGSLFRRRGEVDRIVIRLRHTRKNLSGMIEAIVDEVVQADVVITRQTHRTRSPNPPPEKPGSNAHGYESQRKKYWRQLIHVRTITAAASDCSPPSGGHRSPYCGRRGTRERQKGRMAAVPGTALLPRPQRTGGL